MQPSWLFETRMIEDDSNVSRLFQIVEGQGMVARSFDKDDWEVFEPHSCVIFYGSIDGAKLVRRKASWVPGVFCNFEAYNCTSYYPTLGKYLLNSDYVMIPYGDMLRRKEYLFENFYLYGGDIFVRPDRSDKPFAGQVIHSKDFEKDIELLGYNGLNPSDLCVVSRPNDGIENEWRFVVVDGKVVTGSLYLYYGRDGFNTTAYRIAEELAQEIAIQYMPDRVWTIDICSTYEGFFNLLEINSFSSAGLYECDLETVVREVSRVALEEWESVN